MYAVLYLPRCALQAATRLAEGPSVASSEPTALIDGASKAVVLETNRAAEREGVWTGLAVPKALARCSGLRLLRRSAQAEDMADAALFHAAYSLSPRVERLGLGLAIVDLQGARMERSLARCAALREELSQLGLKATIGVAAASSIALLAAKQSDGVLLVEASEQGELDLGVAEPAPFVRGRPPRGTLQRLGRSSFLDALPMEAAEPGDRLLGILQKWGIRTVGAFAALQREAIGLRLGAEGLQLWDRIHGREHRAIAVTPLPLVFEEHWEFEYDVDSLEPVLFLLRRFLDQLCLRLRAAGKVAERLVFELSLAYGEPIRDELKTPEPTCDTEALFRLGAGCIEKIDTYSPVAAFRLRLEPIDYRQRQLGLFESSLREPGRFAQTLGRLAGIVGAERVGRPSLRPGDGPDVFRMDELPPEVSAMPAEASLEFRYGLALRRFRPAFKALVELQGRDPVWVSGGGVAGPIKRSQGPWMRSGQWWQEEGSWNRTEWDVELTKGGLYRLTREGGVWYLEGEYD